MFEAEETFQGSLRLHQEAIRAPLRHSVCYPYVCLLVANSRSSPPRLEFSYFHVANQGLSLWLQGSSWVVVLVFFTSLAL